MAMNMANEVAGRITRGATMAKAAAAAAAESVRIKFSRSRDGGGPSQLGGPLLVPPSAPSGSERPRKNAKVGCAAKGAGEAGGLIAGGRPVHAHAAAVCRCASLWRRCARSHASPWARHVLDCG